jgi:hypothetical protein
MVMIISPLPSAFILISSMISKQEEHKRGIMNNRKIVPYFFNMRSLVNDGAKIGTLFNLTGAKHIYKRHLAAKLKGIERTAIF